MGYISPYAKTVGSRLKALDIEFDYEHRILLPQYLLGISEYNLRRPQDWRKAATVDIGISDLRLAIEIDGKEHLVKYRRETDENRDRLLVLLGWEVWRVPVVALEDFLPTIQTNQRLIALGADHRERKEKAERATLRTLLAKYPEEAALV